MSTVPYTFANNTGSIPLNELDINFANVKAFANTAGYVTANVQANITAVGTLTSLSVAGNITSNSNIISHTNLIIGGNISSNGSATVANTVTGGNLVTNGTLTVNQTATVGNLLTSGSIGASGAISATGNISGNNFFALNQVSAAGNVIGGSISTFIVQNTSNATAATTGALQVYGGASINKDLWVVGNIYAGNIVGTTANVITIEDPLAYFASPTSTYPYNYDIGFYSAFTGGTSNTYQHTGFARDFNDNTWKLFSNVAEPAGTIIVFDANTVYDAFKSGPITSTGTIDAIGTITGGNILTGGSLSATGNLTIAGNTTLVGVTTAPTAANGTSNTQVATTEFVGAAVYNATSSLGTMSSQNANNVSISGGSVSNVSITGGTISSLASALPATSGGTGVTSPGSAGNVLQSNGSVWNSTALPAAIPGLGFGGSTWHDVTGSRSQGVTYYNTHGYPIQVQGNFGCNGGGQGQIIIDGVSISLWAAQFNGCGGYSVNMPCIVPAGSSYQLANMGGGARGWYELY